MESAANSVFQVEYLEEPFEEQNSPKEIEVEAGKLEGMTKIQHDLLRNNPTSEESKEDLTKLIINKPTDPNFQLNHTKRSIEFLTEEYSQMLRTLKIILITLNDLKQALGLTRIIQPSIRLPVKTTEDLETLNRECEGNRLRSFFTRYKNCRITTIIDSKLLVEYNWSGHQGKRKFTDLRFLNEALYQNCKGPEIVNLYDYENYIKNELRKVKDSINQNRHRQKMANNLKAIKSERNTSSTENDRSLSPVLVKVPIKTIPELEYLNQQCRKKNYINFFESLKDDFHLSDIIDEALLFEYNWNGVQDKKKFAKYQYLHNNLFEVLKDDNMSDLCQYENFIRIELRKIHNKFVLQKRRLDEEDQKESVGIMQIKRKRSSENTD